jgi:SOS-response transcriptional repressor LexA
VKQEKSITRKDIALLKQIDALEQEKGYPPTQEELRHAMGYGSLNTVAHHLRRLMEFDVVSYSPRHPRTIRIKNRSHLATASAAGRN